MALLASTMVCQCLRVLTDRLGEGQIPSATTSTGDPATRSRRGALGGIPRRWAGGVCGIHNVCGGGRFELLFLADAFSWLGGHSPIDKPRLINI
jgi:hypothetical protein